jgi:hypothetical protein
VWFAGLNGPDLHIKRVAARVARGGHSIPEATIRTRYDESRLNLIQLMPSLAELRVYDNSKEADPARGVPPEPLLVLHVSRGKIVRVCDLARTPGWAKPIVAAALRFFEMSGARSREAARGGGPRERTGWSGARGPRD